MWTVPLRVGLLMLTCVAAPTVREESVFYPARLTEQARANARRYPWAAAMGKRVVEDARPWLEMSDEQLWGLMFGATITRSWMVWSDGWCPACKQGVPMYNWEVEPLKRPWKVRCPHCQEVFPKNDFAAFYRSGLGSDGVFHPARADRALLFNAEHPGRDDPLRRFGVDDGDGYVQDGRRWRFIGAYLIYGQWKRMVVQGTVNLACAFLVTGQPAYARKAAVLLDRVADLYPAFDFSRQGLVYEKGGEQGYVSVWHDACEETRHMALAYDAVRSGLADDADLVAFLSAKARQCGLKNPKRSVGEIRANIEQGILRDALDHPSKVHSNYPRTPSLVATISAILDVPASRQKVQAAADEVARTATAVDGVTGEKGLAGYAAYATQGLAQFLALFARDDPEFLKEMLDRHPQLKQTWRFHVDTWCLQSYYPNSGDSGWFGGKADRYVGVALDRPETAVKDGAGCWTSLLLPSMHSFLWQLYQVTSDADYARLLYLSNAQSAEGLPHDLFAPDPAGMQKAINDLVQRQGADLDLPSVNKQQWHLAILRSGRGGSARAVWLDYDSGGRHGHADGMNLGLLAKGLDLMPDFGYPPVNYGGWNSPKARWYAMTAAHNTVVVDGGDQAAPKAPEEVVAGKTTLWGGGEWFGAVRASGAEMIPARQFERTLVMVDVSEEDSYVLDIFRVAGGTDHAKFVHGYYGQVTTDGLTLKPAEDYGHNTLTEAFAGDTSPAPGWSVDWRIEDRYHYLKAGADVHLRYTDLTRGAEAFTCRAWVQAGLFNTNQQAWIPQVMVRRRSRRGPLASTFVGVLEPYEKNSNIAKVARLKLQTPKGQEYPDAHVAVEITLTDGRRDLILAADAENPLGLLPSLAEGKLLVQNDRRLRFEGDLCLVRASASGQVERLAVLAGRSLIFGDLAVRLREGAGPVDIRLDKDGARLARGQVGDVQQVLLKGRSILKR